jgi:hypothetical protein
MPTCRVVIKDALRALKVLAPGDMPHIDQLNTGLSAIQNVALELHEARGPLLDVDVPSSTCPTPPSAFSYTPSENQRIRIQAGFTVTVTLPNSIPFFDGFDPYDYGFNPALSHWAAYAPQGTTAPADHIMYRQPRDGARIETVGTSQQLFFYRADLNQWISVYDIRLDDEIPLNARYAGPFGTMVAERLMEELSVNEPSPGFARRVANARAVMFTRPGTRPAPTRGQYF